MRMVAIQIIERTAQGFFPFNAENDPGNFVNVRYDALRIDQYNPVFDTFNDRFGFTFFVDQPVDVDLLELLEPLPSC